MSMEEAMTMKTTGTTPAPSATSAPCVPSAPTPRPVHLAVYDTYADWETGHTTAHLTQRGHRVRTVGFAAGASVTTMGGVRIQPDLALADLSPEDSSLLILTGASLWDSGDELAPFAAKAREFLAAGVPVAAICGATAGLAREGLLDACAHTSAAAAYLARQPGYAGTGRYVEADAVTDGDLITAGPTEPVAFAREVFARLDVYGPEVLDAWYRLFHDSDASAFPVLMAAAERGDA
ncbi:DJ-1/PfpI family protein [Streptomyces sp. NPDC020817]|uniref:DJ-1/PfpI family protein n=1 Tax=Streptomyces sp. NPDC020817 TaxID=3365095 RepID=UPI0037940F5D